jgi:hypothetical protein
MSSSFVNSDCSAFLINGGLTLPCLCGIPIQSETTCPGIWYDKCSEQLRLALSSGNTGWSAGGAMISAINQGNGGGTQNAAYHYENELRLIHMVKVEDGLIYDWDSEPIKSGKLLNVDLNILIDEITLSPFSPPWFHEIIDDLTTKYNLNKKISFSNLK